MSSGGAIPPQLSNPFAQFQYLFNPNQTNFAAQFSAPPQQQQQQQQRLKLKRQRQRVDAGEPRNSYQGAKSNMSVDSTSALFPWMSQSDSDFMKDEQPTDLSNKDEPCDLSMHHDTSGEDSQLDIETNDDKLEDEVKDCKEQDTEAPPTNDSPVSNESLNSVITSSSKRKQFAPQKTLAETLGFEISAQDTPEEISVNPSHEPSQTPEPSESAEPMEAQNPLEKLSALQSQLNTPSNMNDMLEAQRRLCSSFFEQQRAMMQQDQEAKARIRDFNHLAQSLKNEINENMSGFIDRIMKEWAADLARLAAEAVANRPQMPMFPAFQQPNPLFGMPPGAHSGIFPNTPFNGFNPLAALQQMRRTPLVDDDVCKRKRAKITDSVRKMNGTPLGRESPCSTRSSPQLNLSHSSSLAYFPSTMVGHPLYGGATFEGAESPTNSDDNECPYDGTQSLQLTPMHLRKAKLMFFFTRYPNSALLKSYFPDIRFNKNNTAQLVKWFSNFREYYYIQIDKFARQLLAEGVTSREEIFVSLDSEVYKNLNQHYNRNNHVEPPPSLLRVIQETLREFFDAIKMGKDVEPSWKKTIYKVINRMDDQIPEYFKDPNFLDTLESSQ